MTKTRIQQLKEVEAQLDKLRSWLRLSGLDELVSEADDMSKAVSAAIKEA